MDGEYLPLAPEPSNPEPASMPPYELPGGTQFPPPYDGGLREESRGTWAVVALTLGVAGLLSYCGLGWFIMPIAAIVFGVLGLQSYRRRGFAIAGIVCGAISLLLLLAAVAFYWALALGMAGEM